MIVLGNDKAGYLLKNRIMRYLTEKGIPYTDMGCCENEEGDYPVWARKAAFAVASGEAEKGLLFCGTGVGVSIAANKVKGIRCAVCSEAYSAVMSVEHNDCNMLALGGRVIGEGLAVTIVEAWLNASFAGGRHLRRVEQIKRIEDGREPV
jgi:ribose 5-phosphate isomerase B